ncbi:MAG: hypothetical protein ACXW3R_08685, partial [Rhodoplanes sp.]
MLSRSYLSAIALSVLGWASLAIAFIWIIDPYGTSPIKVSLPRVNALKPSRHNIDRIIKPQEVLARQPRTVFLGTSRIHQSMLDGTRYAPAYNASVPAASIAENIAFLEQYIQLDRNLKHVFFELFLYAFIGPTNAIPEKGPFDLLEDIPKLHFSTSAIRDGIAIWK